jgi:NAD(P)-dependent dehydrogenase (short-subunit alcohol dehydrogenase family)
MAKRAAIVTGPERGIGQAIARELRAHGWYVVGIGLGVSADECDAYCQFDLALCEDWDRFQTECITPVREAFSGLLLGALVNNAAVQHLAPTRQLSLENWRASLSVNLTAPFLLSQAFADDLRVGRGAIANIGSVHAQATKPEFVAYSTSKAALHGLTRALAVDLGGEVRVCAIAPGAISTDMLEAGFKGRPGNRAELDAFHPAGQIGTPEEVAKAVAFVLREDLPFLTGSVVTLDGGILSRLHDPS